jgi:hypothetical protein
MNVGLSQTIIITFCVKDHALLAEFVALLVHKYGQLDCYYHKIIHPGNIFNSFHKCI